MTASKQKTNPRRQEAPAPASPPPWTPARCAYCVHDACATVRGRPICARHIPRAIADPTPFEPETANGKAAR